MPGPLLPHRAGYEIIGPVGRPAGAEELEVALEGTGWRIQSQIRTSWPEEVVASVDWELDEFLVTRLLHVQSRERFSGDHDLELTVTGNGLLAHREAPDGPTQIELGWGPQAELDYISAAFPAVMLARSELAPGQVRQVEAVQIGTVDLVPVIVPQLLRGLPLDSDDPAHEDLRQGPAGTAAAKVECLVGDAGHVALISTAASGALLGYSGLLRLAWLEPTK
jgi:hypothetical protein